jgi:hypothetical protein
LVVPLVLIAAGASVRLLPSHWKNLADKQSLHQFAAPPSHSRPPQIVRDVPEPAKAGKEPTPSELPVAILETALEAIPEVAPEVAPTQPILIEPVPPRTTFH